MKVTKSPSPNFDERPAGIEPSVLVLHYTGMESNEDALKRLCDPASLVSAHYFVSEEGKVLALVDEARRAWHAGFSHWRGVDSINDNSIGIELANPGHEFGYREFPESQMSSLEALAADIVSRRGIQPANLVGHSDIAPGRKQDPGELFDWARLAGIGAGVWLGATHDLPAEYSEVESDDLDWAALQCQFAALGYGLSETGKADGSTRDVITAFQRHWRPQGVTGQADPHCIEVLRALLVAVA